MAGTELLAVNVYDAQDFYVPAFLVKVENRTLRAEMNDIVSVTYSDSLTNVDSFDLTVNNWNPGAEKFDQTALKYSDGDTFNPWKDVELWMGYFRNGQDERRRMLLGEITTLTPNFPQSSAPTLNVRGLNLLHRFRTKQETRPFFNKKDTEIAQTLVNEMAAEIRKRSPQVQLRLDPQDVSQNLRREQPVEYLLMNNQYPIRFLMERARDIGYELSVNEEPQGNNRQVTFNFHSTADVKRKTYILEWGTTLLSFQPTLQTANQVAELTVRGWNPRTKKEIKVTVKRSELRGLVTPSELGVTEPDLAKKMEIVVDRPIESRGEARTLAENRLRQIGEVLVEGRGKTIGVPDLRAGVKIQIKGLGERFSGKENEPFVYLVTSTTHTIGDGGYTTDFTARMEKL